MNAKQGSQERIKQSKKKLLALSHRIHAHPELGLEEEKACAWLCEELADAGFEVKRGICDLPTADRRAARVGKLSAVCSRRAEERDPRG